MIGLGTVVLSLEFGMKVFDVLFDGFDQLGLVFANGSENLPKKGQKSIF
jgi:hypothetical protein